MLLGEDNGIYPEKINSNPEKNKAREKGGYAYVGKKKLGRSWRTI